MIKRFIAYYKPHKKLFIADMICSLVLAFCDLFYPMITRSMINDFIPNRRMRLLIVWAVALLAIYLLKMALNYFVQYYGHLVGVGMQADMRRDVFRHLQKLPFTYFDNHKTGTIMSRIINDLMDISELAHHGPENLFIAAILLVGSFILLAQINIWLTLLLFAACMVYLAAQGRLPARAARMAFLPAAALLFALLAQVLPGGRVACALVAAGCLAFGGWYTVYAVPALTLDEELAWEVGDPAAVLDECALWDNDILFIYDLTLAIDGRLFPNTEEGVPTNVTFWGGWSLRSPGNIEVFDRFGIDLMNFEPEVFLREDVCLATGVADPGPELVLRYLRENVDPTVECSLFGEDQGVYMFQFFIP